MQRLLTPLCAALMCASGAVFAHETVDYDAIARIRQEAFQRSQVMDTLGYLTEQIGPRLTNSPAMNKANEWTKQKLSEWGLSNAHLESIGDFGRGWEWKHASLDVLDGAHPRSLHVLPRAWTPGTNGPVEGELFHIADMVRTAADLEKYKGKLKGKIVLIGKATEYKPEDKTRNQPGADFKRYNDQELEDIQHYEMPRSMGAEKKLSAEERKAEAEKFLKRGEDGNKLRQLLIDEGVVALVQPSGYSEGIMLVMSGGSRKTGDVVGVPAVVMKAVHFNELTRAAKRDEKLKLRLNVDARFTDDKDMPGYNTIAEIPGTGPNKKEVVLLGAHMDSWHAGTGAADNGAGVAVMMEAVRVLKKLNLKPNRTIRIALWTGEEQGLFGSAKYVSEHLAGYPDPKDPQQKKLPNRLRDMPAKMEFKPDYQNFAAYFNYDNGSGKIRGIYTQDNIAVAPIFREWLEPFHDLGANTVTNRDTDGTDHQSFDAVGLPGFQFIQDELDYFSRVHHTDLDVMDHIMADDLKQSSAIIAAFAWQAAQRKEKLPREPFTAE